MADTISCSRFTQWLVDQQPQFDELILADIRPTDSWIGNIATGVFPAAQGVERRLDRFKHVFPNTTKQWKRTQYAGCLGTPCDKTENIIGWGSERIVYYLEEQSWSTPLLCFDQLLHVTDAVEQFSYIIAKILRPATSAIMSNFLRKRTLQFAGQKLQANSTMDPFTFEWTVVGDEEIYFDCSCAPGNVFKLVPQMLQVQFNPLMRNGYAGENPFKEMAPYIELVTDIETCWELDRLGGSTGVGGTPSVSGNWRFTEWTAADAYWRYGFSGQIGNFMVRTDPMGLRFNYVSQSGAAKENAANVYRYQVVLPYVNQTTGGAGGEPGLGDTANPDFDKAHFAISFIMHKKGLTALFMDSQPINPEMPFVARDFGGKWQFVMHDLGADQSGCVIENKRGNKGQFIADFELAIRPEHTEFIVAFFHAREPLCIPNVPTCSADPGYPAQMYDSNPGTCSTDATIFVITPIKEGTTGFYHIPVNSVVCSGTLLDNGDINGSSTLAALVAQIRADAVLGPLGTWNVSGTNLQLSTVSCSDLIIPFES